MSKIFKSKRQTTAVQRSSRVSQWSPSAAHSTGLRADNGGQKGEGDSLFLSPDSMHITIFCCAWGNVTGD